MKSSIKELFNMFNTNEYFKRTETVQFMVIQITIQAVKIYLISKN